MYDNICMMIFVW